MINYWTNFHMVEELPDWTGVALTAGESARAETVRRVLADPRGQQLAGLKVVGEAWNNGVGDVIHEQTAILPSVELLSISQVQAEGEYLPLQHWLRLFPGLEELHFENCQGRIEPCRHLCLRRLMAYNELKRPEFGDPDFVHQPPELQKLEALTNSVYPELEELTLGFQGVGEGSDLGVIERCLPSILRGEAFPNLNLLRLNEVQLYGVAECMLQMLVAQEELAPRLDTIVLWDWPNFLEEIDNLKAWKFVDRVSYPSFWDS